MKYSIGYNFDFKLIDLVSDYCNKENIDIENIQFYTSNPNYYGSLGRNNSLYEFKFSDHVKYIIQKGFSLIYTLNLPIIDIDKIDFIDELLKMGINEFIIDDIGAIEFLYLKYGNKLKINISTVSRINKISQIQDILEKGIKINKVILSHSLNSSIEKLSNILNFNYGYNILFELVGNEIVDCNDCFGSLYLIYKSFLDSGFGGKGNKGCRTLDVNLKKILKFSELSLIRPDDINFFERIGINSVKIAIRRGVSSNKIINIFDSYYKNKHIGNIFYLLGDQGLKSNGDIRYNNIYIKNDLIKSQVIEGKLKLEIGENKERLNFINYFLINKYYKGNFKSYIDYRLDENQLYGGYVASNFSSDNIYNINLRNKLVLNYLKSKISTDIYEKLVLLVNNLESAMNIVYGGYKGYYRIYFYPNEILSRLFNITNINYNTLFMIGLNLNNFSFKYYHYFNENKFFNQKILKEVKSIGDIKFILYMTDNNGREKYYFRFNGGIKYDNQDLINNFSLGIEDFLLKDLYINYIAFDKNTFKKQIYFTNLEYNNISNAK